MAASRLTWPIVKPDSCLTATGGRLDLPDLPDRPYHPHAKVVFLKHAFGRKKEFFCGAQHHWFMQWSFLHYDQGKEVVFCELRMGGEVRSNLKSTEPRLPAYGPDTKFVRYTFHSNSDHVYARDPVTSCAELVFFNRTTCKIVAPALV